MAPSGTGPEAAIAASPCEHSTTQDRSTHTAAQSEYIHARMPARAPPCMDHCLMLGVCCDLPICQPSSAATLKSWNVVCTSTMARKRGHVQIRA